MLNNFVLVGRLVNNPEVKELESGKKEYNITLAVSRSFKNVEGVYDTDFINIILWECIAANVLEYCRKGDIIGVKGRIQCDNYKDDDTSENKYKMDLIAEKVTFLSSKKD